MTSPDKEMKRSKNGNHFAQPKQPSNNISQLLTFLLTLTLMCGLVGMSAKDSFLNQDFTKKQIVTNENVSALHQGLSATVNSFVTDTETNFHIKGDLISKKQVKDDVNEVIDNLYAGKSVLIAPSKIIQQVSNNFMRKVHQAGINTGSEEFLSYKSNFIAQVEAAINNQVHNSLLQKGGHFLRQSQKKMMTMFYLGIVISVILLVALLFQTRSFFRSAHYAGLAFFFNGLIVWLLAQLVRVSGVVDNLAASVGMYQSLITDYGNSVLAVFIHDASFFGYIGLFLLLVALFGRFIRRNN